MNNPNIDFNSMILPIDQYDDILVICFYGKMYGYHDLVITNKDTGEQIVYTEAESFARFDEDLNLFYINVNIPSAGTYTLNARNSEGDLSPSVEVVIVMDTRKEIYKNLVNQMNVDQDTRNLFLSLQNDLNDNSNLIQYIYYKYKQEEDGELKLKYAILLNKIISFYNYRFNRFGILSNAIKINTETKSFLMPIEVNSMMRLTLFDPDMGIETIDNNFINTSVRLQTEHDKLYLYKFLNNNRQIVGLYFLFEPTLDIYNKFLADSIAIDKAYQRAIEKTIQYPSSYLTFSDEEIGYLAFIEAHELEIPPIKAPHLDIDGNTVFVEIYDTNFMAATTQNFYLQILETELAGNLSTCRRIPIVGSRCSFVPSRYNMLNESFFYWIENSEGIIVSNIKILHLGYDKAEFKNAQEKTDDINERIRQLKLYNYKTHLFSYVANYYNNASQIIQDVFKGLESDLTTETSDIMQTLLQDIIIPRYIKIVPDVIRCLHEDRIIYGHYLAEFFDDSLGFKHKSNTVVLPPRANTLYIFESYSVYNEKPIIEYKMAQELTATEYRFTKGQYCIARAIDLTDYKLSGFLFIDLSKNDLIPRYHKYLVEAEVRN